MNVLVLCSIGLNANLPCDKDSWTQKCVTTSNCQSPLAARLSISREKKSRF